MSIKTDENRTSRPPIRGGGCLIAAGLVLGPIIGLFFHQTSIGLMVGLGLGTVAAILLTIAERKR